MSDYAWPSTWVPRRFQMRVEPNTRIFTSPYTKQTQVVDMLAESWRVQLDMSPDVTAALGGEIEAFFDRLKGSANRIILGNLKRPIPLGTMRGSPTVASAVAQFANIVPVAADPGETLVPGDMIRVGPQLCRVLAPAVANGSGLMSVEVAPRLRSAVNAGAAVTWSSPTAYFRQIDGNGGAAVDWTPGMFTAPSIELREDV